MKIVYNGEQAELQVPVGSARLVFQRGVAAEMPDEKIATELLTRPDWSAASEEE